MFRKLGISTLGLVLLASPAFALAQSADVQSQIAALQAEVQALLAQIAQLQGGTQQTSCVNLSDNLTLGSTGSDVTNLQNYLIGKGDLDAQYNTGYYGFITAQAVGKLQLNLGIVSAPSDPAYGLMGPRTRTAISCGGNVPPPVPPNSRFSATPMSGSAPLPVTFSGTIAGSALPTATASYGASYIVNFGDGQSAPAVCAVPIAYGQSSTCTFALYHTYNSAGTYTATLYQYPQCNTGNPLTPCPSYTCPVSYNQLPCGAHVLGTATITVTNGTTSGAPTISGLDAPTSLAVGQTGTWTVHASVPGNPRVQLHYSVVWGDENSYPQASFGSSAAANIQTSATFTHAYATAGTYQPTFTVSNDSGSAQTSASVIVEHGTNNGSITAAPGQQPPNSLAPQGTIIPFTKFTLTNMGSSPVILNSMTVQRTGGGSDAAFVRVAINDELGKGGDAAASFDTSGHTMTLFIPFTLAAGQSKTYTISGYIATDLSAYSGQTTGLSLVGINAAVPVSESLPITGAQQTLNSTLQDVCNPIYGFTCWISTSSKFSASPTSGAAPLAVSFSGTSLTGGSQYIVDYGDGSNSGSIQAPPCGGGGGCSNVTTNHTYSSAGTYTATLSPYIACLYSSAPRCTMANVLLGSATITITANSSPPSCTISSAPYGSGYGVTWTSQNAVTAHLAPIPGMGGGWANVALNNSNPASWVGDNVTYTLTLWDSAGNQATCTTATSAPPSAAIDQSSLTMGQNFYGGTHAITGTVSGVSSATLELKGISLQTAVEDWTVMITGSTWSSNISTNLQLGNYSVQLIDKDAGASNGTILASGTLIVGGITDIGACPANATAYRGQNGTTYSCMCPANGTAQAVWGGGGNGPTYYTDDSNLCSAGAQVGQMNLTSGGLIYFTIDPGQNSYSGFTNNGITSQSWGSWPGSYQITGPKG